MLSLTAEGPITEIDLALVGKVLDHCEAHPMGVLNFIFLDGTRLGVSTQE
jgi:hypothetical protein